MSLTTRQFTRWGTRTHEKGYDRRYGGKGWAFQRQEKGDGTVAGLFLAVSNTVLVLVYTVA